MDYKLINMNSYNMHLIKTNKFKTILVKLIFRDEIKKDEITIRNILLENLLYSSKKYNTKKKLNIKKQDLYGLDISMNNRRIGRHILTEINLSILNPLYTESNMLEQSVDFLCEILFHPNVENQEFDSEYFNIIKENAISEIKSNDDNPRLVAAYALKENMDKTLPFSYKMEGDISDIDAITPRTLYTYYERFLNENIIDIYIAGDIDYYETEKLFNSKLKFKTIKKEKCPIQINYASKNKNKEIVCNSKFTQSKLLLGCYFNKLTEKERKYTIPIYNIILGNSPESKLFKNVREKDSYAYSINSGFRRLDDIMIIAAGISCNNYKNALKSIKHEITAMKNNITQQELRNAKELFISVINDVGEYLSSIIDYYFTIDVIDSDTIEKQIEGVKSITINDIITLAKKIKVDTVFLLKEKEDKK